MLLNALYSSIASLAFGVLFNIRGKNLFFSSLSAGLGWFVYELCFKLTGFEFLSYFIGSLSIGLYSEIMARVLKTPVTAFIICGIIPLVPGGGMYYTMLAFIERNVSKSLSKGFDTLGIAGAIAIGILTASSIVKAINFSKNRKTQGCK